MSDVFFEAPAEPARNRLALFAAILLGLAATLTAFSAYQAAIMDGEALAGYTESTFALGDANYLYGLANQTQTGDRQIFVAYAVNVQHPDATPQSSEYLKTLMRPELAVAVEWWIDTEGASTPFDEVPGNPYRVADLEAAQEKSAAAAEAFEAASVAGDTGDEFQLSTVLFALTLFFGGISTVFKRVGLSAALLAVGAVSLVAGTVQLGTALG